VHLSSWRSNRIKWVPEWIGEISLEPFSLNFVVGPRQVGKTTGIKLLIKRLIEGGVDAEKIVYINCDLIASLNELKRLLKRSTNYTYIFLDEVASIEYWWRLLKAFIDAGLFRNSVITVSGSSSLRIKKYAEAFPGRRGAGKNIAVLPPSFPEFARIKYGDVHGIKLERAFEEYLMKGGFPRSINDDPTFTEDFISSIDREVARVGKDCRIARQLIYAILKKAPSAVSYSSLGKEVEINHVVTREYLNLLEDLFLTKVIFLKEGKHVLFRKEKKVILRDPYIAQIYSWLYEVELTRSTMYEWIVQEHLYRIFGEVYYYRNSYEIDCIAGDLKVEVKAGKTHRKYPRDVVVLSSEEIPRFLIDLYKQRRGL